MPDSIKFTELPSGTLSANSIFATAEEAGGGSFASTKVNAANIGNYLVGALQYAGINTEDKTVEGALNELLTYASNIAEEYDSTATYDEGDFVIYEGVLYKCTTAISTPEAWTPAHWTSTLVVDNFGSGGASVTLGTSAPLDASGENGDLYVQYEALTYKVVEYFVKINNSWRKSPYSRVVALTQAEYDLITPDPTTLYIITDAQSSYATKAELDALKNFESSEVEIGEWTDGKTIYRKILTGTVANNTIDLSVGEKIDTCINFSLLVNKNGINFKAPYRMEDGGNYYQIYCFCNNASGNTNSNIYATFASSTADYFNGCDVTRIVEYTKRS